MIIMVRNRKKCRWVLSWVLVMTLSAVSGCETLLDPYIDNGNRRATAPKPPVYQEPAHGYPSQRYPSQRPAPQPSSSYPSYPSPDTGDSNRSQSSNHQRPGIVYPSGSSSSETDSATREGAHQQEPDVVLSLLETALQQVKEDNLTAAAATTERALRISPRSPLVYKQLAQIRLNQHEYGAAEQLARKALLYVTRSRQVYSRGLSNQLWEIVALAKTGQGDESGAVQARENIR